MRALHVQLSRQDVGAGDRYRSKEIMVDPDQLLSEFVAMTVDPFLPRRQGTWVIRFSGHDERVDAASLTSTGEVILETVDMPLRELLADRGWVGCRVVLPGSRQ